MGFNKCKHQSWNFAPWHRAYLYYFEDIIRKMSGDESFALPYWNWTAHPQVPDVFYGGDENPLAIARRPAKGTKISNADFEEFVSPDVIRVLLASNDFSSFGGPAAGSGGLEANPHNFIHRWVGRTMATGESPLDPLFWLHHANVDRLYSEWIIKHGSGRLPSATTWKDAAFADFFDRNGAVAGGSLKNSATVDITKLGYTYEELSKKAGPEAVGLPLGVAESFASEAAVKKADGVAIYRASAKVGEKGAEKLNNAAQEEAKDQEIRLRLIGVELPENQDTVVRVFINCKDPTRGTPISDPSYAGSFTFFGSHEGHGAEGHGHGEDHAADGAEIVLDITKAFRTLYGDVPLKADEPLNVAMISRALFGEGEAQTVTAKKVIVEQLAAVPTA
jgi:hypothetical protein